MGRPLRLGGACARAVAAAPVCGVLVRGEAAAPGRRVRARGGCCAGVWFAGAGRPLRLGGVCVRARRPLRWSQVLPCELAEAAEPVRWPRVSLVYMGAGSCALGRCARRDRPAAPKRPLCLWNGVYICWCIWARAGVYICLCIWARAGVYICLCIWARAGVYIYLCIWARAAVPGGRCARGIMLYRPAAPKRPLRLWNGVYICCIWARAAEPSLGRCARVTGLLRRRGRCAYGTVCIYAVYGRGPLSPGPLCPA